MTDIYGLALKVHIETSEAPDVRIGPSSMHLERSFQRPTRPSAEQVPSDQAEEQRGTAVTRPDDRVLTPEETKEVQRLQRRDAEVRAHEMAHASVGGAYAGSPSYTYETGPDGRRYAVGGEVQIDTSEIPGDPKASIAKMQQVVRAALAPAQPSGQDRAVAARAQAKIARLQTEATAEKLEAPEADEASPQQMKRAGNAYRSAASGPEQADSSIELISCACGQTHAAGSKPHD